MNFHKNFKDLSRSVKNIDTDNLKNINISILGNHSTQFFTKSIKNQLEKGFQIRSKSVSKSTLDFRTLFGTILERFWAPFRTKTIQ